MLRLLDARAVGEWARACVELLEELRAAIDTINVYPVADADTGSNLAHTMRCAAERVPVAPDGAGHAFAELASGAVSGARGNSGVLLSQLLRGCAEELGTESTVDGPRLAAALDRAARLATAAVAEPVAGTILSVLRAAADAVRAEQELVGVTGTAAAAAAEALARTPGQLAVLADAGVVDAGGRGLLAVLDALHAVVSGEPAPPRPELGSPKVAEPAQRMAVPRDYQYEVMYLLDEPASTALDTLRTALTRIGNCVTLAGDGAGTHAVHVHCDDIGAAIEAGIEAGKPRRIEVTPLLVQAGTPTFTRDRAVLVLLRSEQLAELVTEEGAEALLVEPEQTDPTPAYHAIRATNAAHVVVLAADAELSAMATGAAQQAEARGQDVVVVPCAAPAQALAAMAVHDASRRISADVVAMAEAAAATRYGELRIAEAEALTWVGRCAPGDVLGLVDGEVVLVDGERARAAAVPAAACAVVERMLATGGELVTVLLGATAEPAVVEELSAYLRDQHPEVDLACYRGAGAEAVLLLGVE
ncbi:hypothetical protein EV191_106192 [Tamaricihabitans halophyticus]|uniref:DhaL domain-containing protein n=1 Tax=Tamaricihabitans halophyticus TaxID=1262583 RepID=A0A4R2QTI1_9PSEU|nr:hypothetical protein EV191_106192 [Tamaricihabitans halophyticus]